jgi:S-adenosylmethionine-diacylglycerol 3-amino-3-carboxypropyl transferase
MQPLGIHRSPQRVLTGVVAEKRQQQVGSGRTSSTSRVIESLKRSSSTPSGRFPLVYNQSWEDPAVDLAAVAPTAGQLLLTIASGGCNVLNFAMTGATVLAFDRNPAQVALTDLKVAAARQLPVDSFRRLLSTGRDIDRDLDHLDLSPATFAMVQNERWFQGRGLYAAGVFGSACTLLRGWVRMCDATDVVEAVFNADDLASQAGAWQESRRRIRGRLGRAFLTTPLPASFFGVPFRVWRQVPGGCVALADWVDKCLTTLPAKENWFWQRALLDDYRTASPPYLRTDPGQLGPIHTVVAELEDILACSPPAVFDAAVLLDAMYWVTPRRREAVWLGLHRCLRPKGKVTMRRFTSSCRAPAALFDEIPLEAVDRSGCYAGASLLIRR